ncbi:unnamed protein product [Paramecium primaurelia]|uniref:Uncharacterized protein n=1 Tax=Paramecium primaurelia TaxID=5886 RepID=A0A8S1PYH0_PARPR|nr:unnamed protein product [Paramecium primaurelia]
MNEDQTKIEIEEDSNSLVPILLILLLLIIQFIQRWSKKPQIQKQYLVENDEHELQENLLNKDQQKKQDNQCQKNNYSVFNEKQNNQNEIFLKFKELQEQIKVQYEPQIYNQIQKPQQLICNNSINKIMEIYQNSSQLRFVEDEYKYYIRQFQEKSDLKRNYGLTFQASLKLYKYCNAFREVRGDGNCFYTAFGYQFLCILLFEYTFDQFQEFIDKIRKSDLPMKIFVTCKDLKIDDKQLEKQLLEEFLNRLTKLKQIDDITQRQDSFNTQFAAYEKQSEEIDGCLYGLSTIFFRNYSNYIVDLSINKDAVFDRDNLFKWEEECNSNEVVIAELAKQLNVFVQLIFFQDKDNFVVNEYEKDKQHKIILLIKPGHYNIGYLKKDQQ